jgi:hypothetical protein
VPDHTPAYLRTSDQMRDAMRAMADAFPQLVQLVDIGDSGNKVRADGTHGSDIWMLRLTNTSKNQGKKPVAMHIGGIHAREIANPELLLGWAGSLLAGYGSDPAATALLDTREIDLIPLANPDGHDVVTDGFAAGIDPRIWQRRNTNPAGNVDLNRNFRWNWNGFGTSRDPNNDTFRGASAASEPETQALQGVMEKVHPGILVDWHSFSGLNLYPWGDSFGKAPDHPRLKALAERFTAFNGYTPQQSVDLYPTSGTSIDHAYGVHRIPSIGVETGDNFHPLEPEFADIRRRNEPLISYTAAIADDPYERAQGPDVSGLSVAPDGTLQATASDAAAGGRVLRAAEWSTTPLALPGTGTPLAAADGAFDGVSELLTGTAAPALAALQAAKGPQLVYVRAQDADGHWGPATPQWLVPPAARP